MLVVVHLLAVEQKKSFSWEAPGRSLESSVGFRPVGSHTANRRPTSVSRSRSCGTAKADSSGSQTLKHKAREKNVESLFCLQLLINPHYHLTVQTVTLQQILSHINIFLFIFRPRLYIIHVPMAQLGSSPTL